MQPLPKLIQDLSHTFTLVNVLVIIFSESKLGIYYIESNLRASFIIYVCVCVCVVCIAQTWLVAIPFFYY